LPILADLPGPKIRIGQLAKEPVELKRGDAFTLTTEEIVGDANRTSVNSGGLPQGVKQGDTMFLNDGFPETARSLRAVAKTEEHHEERYKI